MDTYHLFRLIFGIIVIIIASIITTLSFYYKTINVDNTNVLVLIVLIIIGLFLMGISNIMLGLFY